LNVVRSKEAVSLGTAMLAGIGCGVFRDLDEARATIRIEVDQVQPDPDLSAIYDRVFEQRFKPAAAAVRML
jgi:xylulokinase